MAPSAREAAVEARRGDSVIGWNLDLGRIDDDRGFGALVVAIGGTTNRPDGGAYHITWSLAVGRRAEESNVLLADRRWTALDQPMPILLHPARFS